MASVKELLPGESPFDDWDREHLVRFAQRCYAATTAARGVIAATKLHDPESPFWGVGGTGGEAEALIEAVVREVGYDADDGSKESENLYRAFYRTFLPVLFPDAVDGGGDSWFPQRWICDVCNAWNEPPRGMDMGRFLHAEVHCPGVLRLMTPDDLPTVPASRPRGTR